MKFVTVRKSDNIVVGIFTTQQGVDQNVFIEVETAKEFNQNNNYYYNIFDSTFIDVGTKEEIAIPPIPKTAALATNKNENGDTLFTRIHGANKLVASGATETIQLSIPHEKVMFVGAEIVENVTSISDMTVDHPVAGLIEQYGFSVNVGKIVYTRESKFGASLPMGLLLKCEVTNLSAIDTLMGVNFLMIELVGES